MGKKNQQYWKMLLISYIAYNLYKSKNYYIYDFFLYDEILGPMVHISANIDGAVDGTPPIYN